MTTYYYVMFFINYVQVIATLTRWFLLATVTSHWIFSQDYPNFLVSTLDSCNATFDMIFTAGGHCLQSHEVPPH